MTASNKQVLAAVIFYICAFSAFSQQTDFTQSDIKAAETRASHYNVSSSPGGLHASTYKFADNVKGVSFNNVPESSSIVLDKNFPNNADNAMHALYCDSATIVSATAVSSKSRITSDKYMIYTTSQFKVDDVVKAASGITQGATIYATRVGGDVVDSGEKLRVSISNTPPFKAGHSYLLILSRSANVSPLHFVAPDSQTMVIRNGRIYPSTAVDYGILPGAKYSDIKSKFSDLLKTEPCH